MTIEQLSQRLDTILRDIEDKDFDKACIMEDLSGITREQAALHPDDEVSDHKANAAIKGARRRMVGYPLQYVIGSWDFYGRRFKVGEGVLIPRADTETLIDETLKRLSKGARIIDLCSGSGCIAVTLAKEIEGSKVFAVELSGDAFPYLIDNIRLNSADVITLKGDVMNGVLLDNFRTEEGEYIPVDCIVSNPPYLTDKEMSELQTEVTHEPEIALSGGMDGLKFYRVMIGLWKELLKEHGLMIFEIGSQQSEEVEKLLTDNGFSDIFTAKDAADCIRVIGGYLGGK